jgi:hypothetical protein
MIGEEILGPVSGAFRSEEAALAKDTTYGIASACSDVSLITRHLVAVLIYGARSMRVPCGGYS